MYGTATTFNGGTDTLRLDLYWPQCPSIPNQKSPLILFIHGGAFIAGDKNDLSITRLCKEFAKRGYVTASIGYRLGMLNDDNTWSCNYPSYSCVFVNEQAEWIRAYYRGVQDVKGALRYLIHRNDALGIDPNNVFLGGESAGGFLALGTALLDTDTERYPETFALADAPKPNANTASCVHNVGETFANSIPRPDLGGIDGNLEPNAPSFTIKGVGNMYGGMLSDLLKEIPANKPKPALYLFHQPCDLVVPFDSGTVYQGLSWCFANCYNCYGITNAPVVYGSKAIDRWNQTNNYGYNIATEFSSTTFPFNCLFGPGSCLDQVNNPCHAYTNFTTQENNLAEFFAPLVSTTPFCVSGTAEADDQSAPVRIYPNPASQTCQVHNSTNSDQTFGITNALGQTMTTGTLSAGAVQVLSVAHWPRGTYVCTVYGLNGERRSLKMMVQ